MKLLVAVLLMIGLISVVPLGSFLLSEANEMEDITGEATEPPGLPKPEPLNATEESHKNSGG